MGFQPNTGALNAQVNGQIDVFEMLRMVEREGIIPGGREVVSGAISFEFIDGAWSIFDGGYEIGQALTRREARSFARGYIAASNVV